MNTNTNNTDFLRDQQLELMRRLNTLSVDSHDLQLPEYDVYARIEAASTKLSDSDKSDLLSDPEYQNLVGQLNTFIQQEQFRLVRANLNNNKDAVNVMNRIAEYITKFKQENDNKKADTIRTFEDYITNYPDMSYSDYLKLKGGNKK